MSANNRPIAAAMKKLLRQPSFLVTAGVLLISAISLNAATQYMKLYFQKQPVPMREEFTTLPAKLGHWVQISKDERLSEDFEHVLAANKYIYRDYVDDRLIPAKEIAWFEGKSFNDRKRRMMQLQQVCPQGVINIGVTYYTGMVDTVAHIPDRCYIADGFEPTSYKLVEWSAFDGRPGRDVQSNGSHNDARYINFEDQVASRQSTPRNVAYFFHANGHYTANPIDVRMLLQDLRQRYAYYAKIEVMTQMRDPDLSAKVMSDFLGSALPDIERCLPDWKQVTEMENSRH